MARVRDVFGILYEIENESKSWSEVDDVKKAARGLTADFMTWALLKIPGMVHKGNLFYDYRLPQLMLHKKKDTLEWQHNEIREYFIHQVLKYSWEGTSSSGIYHQVWSHLHSHEK